METIRRTLLVSGRYYEMPPWRAALVPKTFSARLQRRICLKPAQKTRSSGVVPDENKIHDSCAQRTKTWAVQSKRCTLIACPSKACLRLLIGGIITHDPILEVWLSGPYGVLFISCILACAIAVHSRTCNGSWSKYLGEPEYWNSWSSKPSLP